MLNRDRTMDRRDNPVGFIIMSHMSHLTAALTSEK